MISACTCKSSILPCVKLLKFSEIIWWSDDGFVDFVIIGVSLWKINGIPVLGIGMKIVGVQNELFRIIGEVFCKFNGSMPIYFSST